MNNLRLSQLERNKEIMNMKRHLLLQESNNLLLQADITRREAELLHYKEYSRKGIPIKRWNTFSGQEDRQRVVSTHEFSVMRKGSSRRHLYLEEIFSNNFENNLKFLTFLKKHQRAITIFVSPWILKNVKQSFAYEIIFFY